ncbi:MAG: 50S ribosomal protein L32 [Acidobacteria bacterium]|nr:MAG: 50S ribosomal protein L32 [Acidobacteriota bacterium]
MPNPKRRHSKARRDRRRAHDYLTARSFAECPNCHELRMPHRACPHCGHYGFGAKEREVLETAEE